MEIISFNSWWIWAAKIIFCYRLYAPAGEMEARADERCWIGGSFEGVLANFADIAILNQIIFLLHIYTWLQFECDRCLSELAWTCYNVYRRQLFSNTYKIFCFDRLKCWVQTAFQQHLCFNDITSYFDCIFKDLHYMLLRIVIL